MIAGPNGSGKSTLTAQLINDGHDLGEYINPDEIAATLEIADPVDRARSAQEIADKMRLDCVERGVSFSFETVMSHPSKVEFLKHCRSKGYQVAIYFVATESASINVDRVAQRVRLSGHDVPEDRIRDRYVKTIGLLPSALRQCDRAVLFDNTYRSSQASHVAMTPFCEVVREADRLQYLGPNGKPLRSKGQLPRWAHNAIRLPPVSPTRQHADLRRTKRD